MFLIYLLQVESRIELLAFREEDEYATNLFRFLRRTMKYILLAKVEEMKGKYYHLYSCQDLNSRRYKLFFDDESDHLPSLRGDFPAFELKENDPLRERKWLRESRGPSASINILTTSKKEAQPVVATPVRTNEYKPIPANVSTSLYNPCDVLFPPLSKIGRTKRVFSSAWRSPF